MQTVTEQMKPKYPYVEYVATRNPGRPEEFKEPFYFNLESSTGTLEHVLRYERKGWPIVGHGHLAPAHMVSSSSDTIYDEHQKIRAHIDNQLKLRADDRAEYRKSMEDPRATLETKVAKQASRQAKAIENVSQE